MVVQTPEGILEVRNATIRANRIEADSYKFDSTSNLEVGTANLFVDTTTSNVGIGTNAPLVRFDVNGDIQTNNRIFNSGFGMIIPLVQSKNMRVVQAYTGSDVSFTVPSGVTRIYAKLWGAGGGGGSKWGWGYAAPGGGGGFTHGVIATTPGETLTLIVGQGGTNTVGTGSIYGGGGNSVQQSYPGKGGGRTAIRRGGTELMTAGGGGAGSATQSALYGGKGNRGGAGGGLHGQNGASGYNNQWSYQGGGGGQSLYDIIDLGGAQVGASYGDAYGSQFQGGGSHDYGGAGGGGWYGGGSGQYVESNTMGGGGGGSGYVGGCIFGQTFTGHWEEPANIADVDYTFDIGYGGAEWTGSVNSWPTAAADIANQSGKNGFMVIYY
jgi:hypothetical protein